MAIKKQSHNKTAKHYFKEYTAYLETKSDLEIVDAINNQVGIRAYGIPRQGHLWALRNQLEIRGIVFNVIGDENVMSFANKIELFGKTLF